MSIAEFFSFVLYFIENYRITFTGPSGIVVSLIILYFMGYNLFFIGAFLYNSIKRACSSIVGGLRGGT